MSVSWQNRRRGQPLVAHGRVKKQQKNNMFLNYAWMSWLMASCRYLKVWHSRFVEQRNWKCDDLLMCRLKVYNVQISEWGSSCSLSRLLALTSVRTQDSFFHVSDIVSTPVAVVAASFELCPLRDTCRGTSVDGIGDGVASIYCYVLVCPIWSEILKWKTSGIKYYNNKI